MALFISSAYRNKPVMYSIDNPGDDIYLLRLHGPQGAGDDFLPGKIVLRRKGKIWVSDAENCPELIQQLTAEVRHLNTKNKAA